MKIKKNTNEFYKKPSDEDIFEQKIVEDIIKNEPYEHKRIETPHVEPTVQDAQTTENETRNEIDDFLQTASEFNKIDAVATKEKQVDFYDKLFDDVQEVIDSRHTKNDAPKTDNIFMDDELFSDTDTKDIKNLVDMIKMETDVNNILFNLELVDLTQNVPLPPDPTLDFSDVLLTKNKQVAKGSNKAAKKLFKKYQKMRQNKDKMKN